MSEYQDIDSQVDKALNTPLENGDMIKLQNKNTNKDETYKVAMTSMYDKQTNKDQTWTSVYDPKSKKQLIQSGEPLNVATVIGALEGDDIIVDTHIPKDDPSLQKAQALWSKQAQLMSLRELDRLEEEDAQANIQEFIVSDKQGKKHTYYSDENSDDYEHSIADESLKQNYQFDSISRNGKELLNQKDYDIFKDREKENQDPFIDSGDTLDVSDEDLPF